VNHRASAQSLHRITEWHKSSHSKGASDCVEASGWCKSSHSKGADDCVEVGGGSAGWVGVRDSKLGVAGPVLLVAADSWRGLLAGLRTS
jgi:Domain of unknown function (DUF397)